MTFSVQNWNGLRTKPLLTRVDFGALLYFNSFLIIEIPVCRWRLWRDREHRTPWYQGCVQEDWIEMWRVRCPVIKRKRCYALKQFKSWFLLRFFPNSYALGPTTYIFRFQTFTLHYLYTVDHPTSEKSKLRQNPNATSFNFRQLFLLLNQNRASPMHPKSERTKQAHFMFKYINTVYTVDGRNPNSSDFGQKFFVRLSNGSDFRRSDFRLLKAQTELNRSLRFTVNIMT